MSVYRALSLVVVLVAGVLIGLDVTVCPTAGIFGVPCPSCGLTRATIALGSGHWQRAHHIYPGVVPVLVYVVMVAGASRWWRRSAKFSLWVSVTGVVLVAGLTLLWGARFIGYFGGPVAVNAWW